MGTLKINSVFKSISGEAGMGIEQGAWCTFIRLQGCNLKCKWCDAPGAQTESAGMEIEVRELVARIDTQKVFITGGEPLLQKIPLYELIKTLTIARKTIQIETNGSKGLAAIPHFNQFVSWVVDYKCPSSGMEMMMPDIYAFANSLFGYRAIVKFVTDPEQDLDFIKNAIQIMARHMYNGSFIISPMNADISTMAGITEYFQNSIPEFMHRIIFSLQIHKLCNLP
jgi:7-carboxy-7-deazaguanine synthase